jgi:hypothetical protein
MNETDVFINCPFSPDYQTFFRAIVFTIFRSGFQPRCALEYDDGGQVRFEKICGIIADCRYGIHDISNTSVDAKSGLPRFNMPLELGLFLGARKFGGRDQRRKKTLIFDREKYRYQAFISDIAGQDIHAHADEPDSLIEQVARWLREEARDSTVPGGRAIAREFARFHAELPSIAATKRLEADELSYLDLGIIAREWILAERGAR